jgi:hypothetical protein
VLVPIGLPSINLNPLYDDERDWSTIPTIP